MDMVSYLLGKNAGGGGSSIPIATEITENSTNEEAAGAKAVYDFVGEHSGGTTITYGTTDLTPRSIAIR